MIDRRLVGRGLGGHLHGGLLGRAGVAGGRVGRGRRGGRGGWRRGGGRCCGGRRRVAAVAASAAAAGEGQEGGGRQHAGEHARMSGARQRDIETFGSHVETRSS
ncbi:hypothetical protein BSLA_02f1443 [Burkholderia stabilis]|nr:hypothetical protein BSLA_02f1443 [Burkholderia stabilis]